MKVILTEKASDDLTEVWRFNAERHGVRHADGYVGFLKKSIKRLSSDHALGLIVDKRSKIFYRLYRKSSRGHGHIAVYRIAGDLIEILHVFHTSQDWPNVLRGEIED